ncbi:MAG TPA: DUF4214 domain-containing protein [Usitatibacter sp.]|nr:DUF4214 domain-containing protein [Usitatibacter sp.]
MRSALCAVFLMIITAAQAQTVQAPVAVGSQPVAIAVNPVTNKVYVANRGSNTVTVIDGATRATTTVNVGAGPTHIAVNPERNRIFVGNVTAASVSVIDGSTDTVVATLATGGAGWTAVNPLTDRAYVLRTSTADEVNVLQGDGYALTSATRSYTPVALAINPVNNYLYIVHQTTGDIVALDVTNSVPYPPRVCPDGMGGIRPFDEHEADPPPCINVPDTPVAVAINPVTNTVYAVSSTPTNQISVINGTNHTFASLSPPGVGSLARAIAVNPLTNKIYAAFDAHVVVVDGATQAMTVIPSGAAGSGPVAIGINISTNRIYVPNANGTLTVINGADNAASTLAIPAGANSIAVNPVTNVAYVLGNEVTPIVGAGTDVAQSSPITTSITPLPSNTTNPTGAINLQVSNTFTPAALAGVRKVYYRFDTLDGPWQVASGSGPFTASFTGLSVGAHTLYAFATNGLDAPSFNTTPQHTPLVGRIASYAFTVSGAAPATPQASLSPTSIDFGAQSMGTTSPPRTITVTNVGGGTLTITGIAASSQFAQTNDCGSVAAGASCAITVTFNPAVAEGGLNSSVAVNGTLTVSSNGTGSPNAATLTGSAEKSLVMHYYRSILRRDPDSSGKAFWESEAQRLASLGANPIEAVYAMASSFYNSPEYAAFNRSDSAYITDLYSTFFNRAPDSGGLNYWTGQLAAGLPREVLLLQFMFSSEFRAFAAGIFGNTAARAEVDVVMDFYRGMLGRLPDSSGFTYWVGQFRTAQCQGAGAVYQAVQAISAQFQFGGEYAARGRTNAQFVADLYNSFLRRGGETSGVRYWVDELDAGRQTRNDVRIAIVNTPEMNSRVNSVVAQGCLQ